MTTTACCREQSLVKEAGLQEEAGLAETGDLAQPRDRGPGLVAETETAERAQDLGQANAVVRNIIDESAYFSLLLWAGRGKEGGGGGCCGSGIPARRIATGVAESR